MTGPRRRVDGTLLVAVGAAILLAMAAADLLREDSLLRALLDGPGDDARRSLRDLVRGISARFR